jgi:LytR cell envelope-related transcriptional attenuator
MDLIERIGSYVGLASFLGLAILALLYFSQARDVRRLREWAGRAPERAVELEQTAAQTQPETPATHVPPALPAAQHSLPGTAFSETAVRRRKPLRERVRNVHIPQARYLALTVAGVLVLGGAAYGAVELIGGGEDGTTGASNATSHRKQPTDGAQRQVNVDPAQVTVAVLNGTTVQGLATKISEEARAAGFNIGTVGNAARIDQTKSTVLYRKGQGSAARAVANRLGIQATGPVDSVNGEIAGSFDAVVVVGSDKS